jgi:hypothetical protein
VMIAAMREPEAITAQSEVLAALRSAAGVGVVWPWDRLDEFHEAGASSAAIKAALAGIGLDPAHVQADATVAEVIDAALMCVGRR